MASDDARATRAATIGFLVLLGPVAVGVALTASVFGAIVGLPLLVGVLPPCIGLYRMARTGHADLQQRRRWAWWSIGVAGVGTVLVVVAVSMGADDLRGVVPWTATVLALAACVAMFGVGSALRPRPTA